MREMSVKELNFNAVTMIGDDWMLITAGNDRNGYNTMTASWGHIGVIWSEPTAVIYIRPQRYTKEFVDREEYFTLSVLSGKYRRELAYLGSHSGRDEDKIAKTGLTPVCRDGMTYFAEAEKVFLCRKLYHAPIKPEGFVDEAIIDKDYPERDFHEMYIGKIEKVLVKD